MVKGSSMEERCLEEKRVGVGRGRGERISVPSPEDRRKTKNFARAGI